MNSSKTRRAVAACARALAGIEDADALVAQATAPTHSGLRAFADRVVLQRRFHDAAIHQQHHFALRGADAR